MYCDVHLKRDDDRSNLLVAAARRESCSRFVRRAALIGGAVIVALALADAARAQTMALPVLCMAGKSLSDLASKHEETPVGAGIAANGNLFQVYSSATKGGWTLLFTTPQGRHCVIASGQGWETLPVVVTGDPA